MPYLFHTYQVSSHDYYTQQLHAAGEGENDTRKHRFEAFQEKSLGAREASFSTVLPMGLRNYLFPPISH